MAHERVERLCEDYAAVNRRDFDAAFADVHPDLVWENDPGGPLGPRLQGAAE